MGLLIRGEWHDQWYDTDSTGGEFVRQESLFRHWIGERGQQEGFNAESGRYHLFVSLACPWAHRTLIFRKLKQLEQHIGVTVVAPEMLEQGWEVKEACPIDNIQYLHQVYTHENPDFTGRVTVPVLWDKKQQRIVNNESSEVIRIFNEAFNDITGDTTDYYPYPLRLEIDKVNQFVYDNINNGVYRCGFATTQKAYESNFKKLFDALERIEQRLNNQRYLLGSQITEADWRLFTTLIRFDAVYYSHFKTNLKRIEDYPNLSNYLRDLYQQEGISDTVNFEHIKTHYYFSHPKINPTRIIPLGPELNYERPHDRDRF